MAVDFAIRSFMESCSRVAHWSGNSAKASTTPIARRFMVCGKAVDMPLEVIVTKWFKSH
jgi:hypothetical protein